MLGVGKVFCKKGWDFLLLALLPYFYRPPSKKSSFWWNMVFQFIQSRLWEMVNIRKIKDWCGPLKLYSKKLKAFLSWPAITEQDGVGRSFGPWGSDGASPDGSGTPRCVEFIMAPPQWAYLGLCVFLFLFLGLYSSLTWQLKKLFYSYNKHYWSLTICWTLETEKWTWHRPCLWQAAHSSVERQA